MPLISSQPTTSEPGNRSNETSGHRFRPDIQGLRAVAVLVVIAYHARIAPFTGGFIGVDVFFVISGFVITGYLVRQRERSTGVSMAGFYANRARRIIPAASVVIVATVVATYHFLGVTKGNQTADAGLWSAVFLSNYHAITVGTSYFGAVLDASPLLHFWSLAVEEQFYLIFPLMFVVLGALVAPRRFRRIVLVVLALAIIGSFLLGVYQTTASPVVAFFSPFTRAWELATGAIVALMLDRLAQISARNATILGWAGLMAIMVASVAYTDATRFPGVAVLVPVVAAALIIVAGASRPRVGPEVILGWWGARRIGDLSYSLYLWHFPILMLAFESSSKALPRVEKIGLLVAIFVISVLSYAVIENPLRRSPAISGARRPHWSEPRTRRPSGGVDAGAVRRRDGQPPDRPDRQAPSGPRQRVPRHLAHPARGRRTAGDPPTTRRASCWLDAAALPT